MKNIVELMKSYGSYHTKEITKKTHFLGVPCIVFALLILLSWIPIHIGSFSIVWIAVFILLIYYLYLDIGLGLVSALFFIPLTYLAELISGDHFTAYSFGIFLFFFVFGWIVQLVGHHYEGNRPALLDNIFQVFVAPLFLVAELVFRLGFRKDLQAKVLSKR